jgi:hypothetical protein
LANTESREGFTGTISVIADFDFDVSMMELNATFVDMVFENGILVDIASNDNG